MNIRNYCLSCLILLLAGCQKIEVSHEFSRVKQNAQKLTGHDIEYIKPTETIVDNEISKKLYEDGISRTEAIGISLKNNPELQAYFETLGIAKADLEQAGLYTNPDIHGFFWPPLQKTTMELETGAFFNFSDLWQVPLKKQVQKDILETITFKILGAILETMKEMRLVYDKTLFAQKQLQFYDDILKQTIDLRATYTHRQDFGLSSDLDNYSADMAESKARIDLIHAQNELAQSYIDFKKVLGIAPTPEPVKLTERFDEQIENFKRIMIPLEKIQKWALTHRPEILNAHMKIKQLKDTISLEKSKIFGTVNAGVSFKRDFSGSKGIGPSFELSLPLFDQNQAQIAKAEFLLEQAKKELIATQLEIQKEVQKHYIAFMNLEKELDIYNKELLPANEKALKYTEKFEPMMQITMVTLLETKTKFSQNKLSAIEINFHALNEFSKLERAIGKRIDLLYEDMHQENKDSV